LLFPSQKRLGRARIEGSRGGRNRTGQIMQRGAWSQVINKQEDSLTNQIRLHLNTPKQIVGVSKFKIDNLLGVGEGNKGCCHSRWSHGCVGCCCESRNQGERIWRRRADINASSSTSRVIRDNNSDREE